nr:hypothetical protein [Tanacetum cinerariifolium]
MHNNIMAAGSRDRPPVLVTGRYVQWPSRFLRYIDTRPNGDALRKCLLEGPYTHTTVVVPDVPTTDDSPTLPEHTTLKKHGKLSKGYNKVNPSTFKMSKQTYFGSLVNSPLTMEKRWKWSRFVTIVKQQHKLDEVSYHKLFDILKQYQKEVNELLYERIARNANPVALFATAQLNQDPYYRTPKPHKPYAPTSKASILTRSHATTRNKGKEIAKPITPLSESDFKEDSDPEQAQRDKDMQKNLALIAKTVNVVRARKNVGNMVVQQYGIQCFNCKEFGHFAKECKKPKRVKDSTYHKEKISLCKQAEKGVPFQAEQSDWLADTNDEIDEQELDAHYIHMAMIQEIQKHLKKVNTSLAHELEQCKYILFETSKTLEESNSIRDSCLVALKTKQTEFEKYKACNDRTVDYDKLKRKLNETLGLLAQKDIDIKEGLKLKAYKILVVKAKHDELVKRSLLKKPHYEGLVKEKIKPVECLWIATVAMRSCGAMVKEVKEGLSKLVTTQILPQTARQAVRNINVIKPGMYRIDTRTTKTRAPQLPQTYRNTNPRMSTSTGVTHKTNVSRPSLRSTQMRDKVMPNTSQVKFKKTEVEDHQRIFSISNKTKSLTACNDSLKSKTLNVNVVCAACEKCMFNSNHDACVSKFLNDVNAKTKKPKLLPISTRQPKSQANKSVATPPKKTVAS